MASGDTKALIERAVRRFGAEVPALRSLALVVRLELRARGGAPVWRVELPGPAVSKDSAHGARIEVSVPRSHFNALAEDGNLRHWVEAYQHGHVRVSGDAAVIKLIANVIERRLARAR